MSELIAANYELIIAMLTAVVGFFGWMTVRSRIQLNASRKDIEGMQASNKHQSDQLQLVKDLVISNAQRETHQTTLQAERETSWNATMTAREEVWRQTIKELATAFTTGLENLLLEQRNQTLESQRQNEKSERTMLLVAQTTGNLSEVLKTQLGSFDRVEKSVNELSTLSVNTHREIRDWVFNLNDNSDHLLKTMEAIRDYVVKAIDETMPRDIKNSLQEIRDIAEKTYQRLETTHEKTTPLPTFSVLDAVLYGPRDVDDTNPGAGNDTDSPPNSGVLPDSGP